jgi:hypothetical protein
MGALALGLGIVAVAAGPSAALARGSPETCRSAVVKPALVKPAPVSAAVMRSAVVRPALVRPALVRSALVRPALVKPMPTSRIVLRLTPALGHGS